MSKTKVGSSLGDDPRLSFLLSDFKDRISFNLSLFCILYSRLPVPSSLVCYSQNKKKKTPRKTSGVSFSELSWKVWSLLVGHRPRFF